MSYDFQGKRVYLSGPMTGMPDWNRAEFARVCAAVCQRGAVEVRDPALRAPGDGEAVHGHAHYMLEDLQVLTLSLTDKGGEKVPYWDAIVMLGGWQDSSGARAEHTVARACGIEVVDWEEEAVSKGTWLPPCPASV